MIWSKKAKKEGNNEDNSVIRDEGRIEELLTRGVENIYPSKDFLKKKLLNGERVTLYLGIDPTGSTLHLGHTIPLKKLKEFQDLGHGVILLIGDFTGMIGDPTDKSATRKKLTHAEVLTNAKLYKKQASTFLNFEGSNPAELKYNSEWLGKLNFGDVLELSSLVTVDQMLKRDMFENRMKEGKPIYIHEFMYPLMQGFDSVAMNVDGEIGGNDQTFNMLMGRDLLKTLKNKEKFVVTCKLLTDSSGKKMGKTDGNAVSANQTAPDMFGKVMSWSDSLIPLGFELCTFVPTEEIKKIKAGLDAGENPRDAKVRLAKEIVSVYHGSLAAERAVADFESTFAKGGVPEDAPVASVNGSAKLSEILLENNLVKSKTDFKRLVDEGAISEIGQEPITSYDEIVIKSSVWRIGKKRFLKVEVSK
ncbi:MAG: tyrosine--tRNA ligase [bacterium]